MIALQDAGLLRHHGFIGGQWQAAQDGRCFAVTDPASGECLGEVADLGAAETRQAIAVAEQAFQSWGKTLAKDRSAILRRWFDLIIAHSQDLALLMTREQGKPLAEALGEVRYAASFIEWFAEEAKRSYGDTIPSHLADRRLVTVRQPVGVCAVITPWNFPAAMLTRKVAAAFAAGCTVVAKPAEQTPFTALALAELAQRAGLPEGVFNIVCGTDAAAIGLELCSHPAVRKLSFTGSTAVGRLLMSQCAPTMKRLSLELGGNAPFIVFDDADLDAAVEGALISKYRNAGQTCVCANRFLVQDGVYEAFATKLAAAVAQMKVGNGMEAGVVIGPLIDAAAVRKVDSHVRDALDKGARVLTGGAVHTLGGNFYQPTVLADVTPAMRVAREETFGPVSPLFRFSTEDEAIRMANDTEFGLAAYFYTRDAGRVWRVGEGLEYGMVGINTGAISSENIPFGGMKQSGLGREGSRLGIEEYQEVKFLCMAGV